MTTVVEDLLERIAKALETLVKIEVQRRGDELERFRRLNQEFDPGRKP